MDLRWATLDNSTGERTLKQHCFKKTFRREEYTLQKYESNVSLCGKICFGGENEEETIELIIPEEISNTACKICLSRFKTLEKREA